MTLPPTLAHLTAPLTQPSPGSQFFIIVKDSHFLDEQYTVFGEVIEGMEVADKIVDEKRDRSDNPLERVEMQVTIEEREF